MSITQEMGPKHIKKLLLAFLQCRNQCCLDTLASVSESNESNQDLANNFSQNKYERITLTWTWCWNLTQILEANPGKWNLDMGVQLTPKKKNCNIFQKAFHIIQSNSLKWKNCICFISPSKNVPADGSHRIIKQLINYIYVPQQERIISHFLDALHFTKYIPKRSLAFFLIAEVSWFLKH